MNENKGCYWLSQSPSLKNTYKINIQPLQSDVLLHRQSRFHSQGTGLVERNDKEPFKI